MAGVTTYPIILMWEWRERGCPGNSWSRCTGALI